MNSSCLNEKDKPFLIEGEEKNTYMIDLFQSLDKDIPLPLKVLQERNLLKDIDTIYIPKIWLNGVDPEKIDILPEYKLFHCNAKVSIYKTMWDTNTVFLKNFGKRPQCLYINTDFYEEFLYHLMKGIQQITFLLEEVQIERIFNLHKVIKIKDPINKILQGINFFAWTNTPCIYGQKTERLSNNIIQYTYNLYPGCIPQGVIYIIEDDLYKNKKEKEDLQNQLNKEKAIEIIDNSLSNAYFPEKRDITLITKSLKPHRGKKRGDTNNV